MKSCTAIFNRDGRAWLAPAVLFIALFCGSTALFAQPTAEPKRFLFIIDTSASMKPFENAVRESMFDLIYSGVRGHMTNGDTYGIWLVSDENDTSFKMETWKKQYIVEMAARAATHVKEHGFKGKAKLAQTLADAAGVIKNVEDLKVVLISNGETPIGGTPFDDVINVRFRELAPHMKRAKTTLNTALVAQDGQIVAWAANSPDFLVQVPYVAPKPKPAKPKVAATQTNVPTAALANALPVTNIIETPRPRAVVAPIIITKETVAQEKRTYQSMTSTATSETVTATNLTNSVARAEPTATTNAVAAAAATNVVETKPVANVPNTPVLSPVGSAAVAIASGPAAKTTGVVKTEPTNTAAAVFAALPVTPMKAAMADTTPTSSPLPAGLWVAIGAGAALAGVLGIFLICRGKRQQPSLISQSLARERVQTS